MCGADQSDKGQCPLARGKAAMSSQGRYLPSAMVVRGREKDFGNYFENNYKKSLHIPCRGLIFVYAKRGRNPLEKQDTTPYREMTYVYVFERREFKDYPGLIPGMTQCSTWNI